MKYITLIFAIITIAGCRNSTLFYSKINQTYMIKDTPQYQYDLDNNNIEDITFPAQVSMQYQFKKIDNNQVVDFKDNKQIILKARKSESQ